MTETTHPNIEQQVLVDQVRHVYRPIVYVILGNTIASVAVLIYLWQSLPGQLLYPWFSLMTLASVYRLAVYFHYRKKFKPELSITFGRYYTIGSALYGILWGTAGVLFFTQNNSYEQIFFILVLLGTAGAGVITKTAWLPAIHAFIPITLLPISMVYLFSGDPFYISLSFGVLAFIMVIYVYAIHANKDLKETFKLRYENIELLEQLKQQKEDAVQSNKAKSRFLAAASHDLRQPLHALTLLTSVLNESDQTPQNRKVVNQLVNSVESLEDLFNSLLDISRLDAGTLKADCQVIHLQPVIQRLMNDFEQSAKEKGLELVWPEKDAMVTSDPVLLEQILRNFISNAIRYTRQGQVKISINSNKPEVLIRVSDTGIGIAKEEQANIFDEFYQINNQERDRSKGLGLGLAIVKRTADLLGHQLDVSSEPGKGSVFSIALKEAEPIQHPDNSTRQFGATTFVEYPGFFVVIDDDSNVLTAMQNLLHSWDYEVVIAANQRAAMQQLRTRNQRPDAIVSDYRLPENHTGIEVIQAIQSEFGDDIPALIITGDTAVEQLREVNNSGYQVLHKPVSPIKLRTFLRNTLRQVAANKVRAV